MARDTLLEDTFGLEAKNWAHQRIEVRKGDKLHYVVRESEGDDFDFYIVPEENVTEDAFWTDHALLKKTNKAYYRGEYSFKTDGIFSVIISNDRAKSVLREIYVKLQSEPFVDSSKDADSESQKIDDKEDAAKFIRNWKLPIILILSTIILSAIVFFLIPGLAYLVTFAGGSLLTLYLAYRKETQARI